MSLHFDSLALPVRPGYRVGPWQVGAPIATSAFATVYAAERPSGTTSTTSGTAVAPVAAALKFLPPGTRTERQLQHLRRITERQPELLRGVPAPRLVRTHEIRTIDDPSEPLLHGATVLVMERAESSLGELLRHGPCPVTGPGLLAQICDGLRQLHRAGWVHGGLTPGNVLLLPDRTVRLGDFHLATEPGRTGRGRAPTVLGYAPALRTTDCTAPELLWSADGEREQPVGPAVDLWAFGVLAHLVLTGSHPLPGATPGTRRDAAVRYARGEEELRLSAGLPDAWRDIVRDCLARTPEERGRIDTAGLLRRVEAAAGTRPSPRLPSPRLPRRRLARRGRLGPLVGSALLWGLATGVVVAGVVGGLLVREAPMAEAAGYDRCTVGDICFFSEENGQGEMCAWYDDERDWHPGFNTCEWGRSTAPKSVLNNGYEGELPHARFYGHTDFQEPVGCLQPLERRNLDGRVLIRSVRWLPNC
ncbi:protein kinase domain-containing protein [Streptomyces yaizuensis]|uniref:non-specific serine/threonine protein kinase n=1 Tax=Streptomyces yaizuensis TaxID=2989713 RepID=A0ABQ5P5A4_9ACTN|nr:protein kinase [Streptomyces sp. YSPA8]GLF97670.1 protein kinase [Streptomyces sp. YSPA8]